MKSEESEPGVEQCYVPECEKNTTETYSDGFGNELPLCGEHYYEAVYPGERVRTISKTVQRQTANRGPLSKILFGGGDGD